MRFKLGNAGHILGSCFIRFWSEKEGWSLVFSGDLGATHTPILPDPDIAECCDLLILESTYGDRFHEDHTGRIERLGDILLRALSDGGKVFIPAFALGRTQELIYEMDRLFADKKYESAFSGRSRNHKIPVFVDSPLGLEITEIYSGLSAFWDEEARKIHAQGDHPIDFAHLYAVQSHREHLRLLNMPGPAVILAGSGMCTGGRILNHLAQGLSDSRNDILFVGYQARGTLGRDIVESSREGGSTVRVNGDWVSVEAAVNVLGGYSAHADRQGLVEWVEAMPAKPGKIKLVHGEDSARRTLAGTLEKMGHVVA